MVDARSTPAPPLTGVSIRTVAKQFPVLPSVPGVPEGGARGVVEGIQKLRVNSQRLLLFQLRQMSKVVFLVLNLLVQKIRL